MSRPSGRRARNGARRRSRNERPKGGRTSWRRRSTERSRQGGLRLEGSAPKLSKPSSSRRLKAQRHILGILLERPERGQAGQEATGLRVSACSSSLPRVETRWLVARAGRLKGDLGKQASYRPGVKGTRAGSGCSCPERLVTRLTSRGFPVSGTTRAAGTGSVDRVLINRVISVRGPRATGERRASARATPGG